MIKSTAALLHFFFTQLDIEIDGGLSTKLMRDILALFQSHNIMVHGVTTKNPDKTVLTFKDKSTLVLTPDLATRCVKMDYENPPTKKEH